MQARPLMWLLTRCPQQQPSLVLIPTTPRFREFVPAAMLSVGPWPLKQQKAVLRKDLCSLRRPSCCSSSEGPTLPTGQSLSLSDCELPPLSHLLRLFVQNVCLRPRETVWWNLKKVNTETPRGPAIPLLTQTHRTESGSTERQLPYPSSKGHYEPQPGGRKDPKDHQGVNRQPKTWYPCSLKMNI